jgi:hypothetical protein
MSPETGSVDAARPFEPTLDAQDLASIAGEPKLALLRAANGECRFRIVIWFTSQTRREELRDKYRCSGELGVKHERQLLVRPRAGAHLFRAGVSPYLDPDLVL